MVVTEVHVGIIHYEQSMSFVSQGLHEMLTQANRIAKEQAFSKAFIVHSLTLNDFKNPTQLPALQLLLITPNIQGDYYLHPDTFLLNGIQHLNQQGTIIGSVCAGAFILAATGLLKHRHATTHWALEETFIQKYPETTLDIHQILVNEGDIITAAGLMAWVDLGLEIIAQLLHPRIMQQVGKFLLVDTGQREQRYYHCFTPYFKHGDKAILQIQYYLQQHLAHNISIKHLAQKSFLSERTFLRRFNKATTYRPSEYLQRLRMQKACDLLETTSNTFESIATQVGYEDGSAFRKVFCKIVGLTPREYRQRFSIKRLPERSIDTLK